MFGLISNPISRRRLQISDISFPALQAVPDDPALRL
jgi:hypothetical protein